VTIPAGRYVIGFNATARLGATSAAIAIDDVVLLEGSCDIQGSTVIRCDVFMNHEQNTLKKLAFSHI